MNVARHLRVYSYFNFLDSVINPDHYLDFLVQEKSKIAPLTNTNSVFGMMDFVIKARKKNLKPILGLTISELKIETQTWEITVYPQNFQGYQNLLIISSQIMSKNEKAISLESIKKYLTHTQIVLSLTNETTTEKLGQCLENFAFLNDEVYGGITSPQLSVVQFEKLIPREKMIIFYPVRYLQKNEKKIYEIVQAIKNKVALEEISDNFHYWTEAELSKRAINKELLPNWEAFVNRIDIDFTPQFQNRFTEINFNEQKNNNQLLKKLCEAKLTENFPNNDVYRKRYEYELQIIQKHGFVNYFLVVWDYVKFARENDILIGPGRGSAAGSLIAFLLGITKIDPIKFELLFERFLNPERTELPDIDLDFEDSRRAEIIRYIFRKYTPQRAALVSTFQRIGARLAIRDIGRVMKIPLSEINQIAKAIPLKLNNNWAKAIESSLLLQKYNKKYPELFATTYHLIGFPRQQGIHAAGIVLSDQDLETVTGVWKDYEENTIIQTDMTNLPALGLVKMDILGLRNLTLISKLLSAIGVTKNKNEHLQKIDLNDTETYNFLQKGETIGLFQLGSSGMTSLLKKLKPTTIEDIALTISLFRPGPMQNIPTFLKRKSNPTEISYVYPEFASILKSTMGFPIYQEQIIQMVQIFVGFSYGKSDLLRKAISKKNHQLAEEFRQIFFAAAKTKGHSKSLTDEVWKLLERFAHYGFNRSHALSYAYISYFMTYFKLHYFSKFMSLLLNSVIGDENKTKEYLTELIAKKITILSPKINGPMFEYKQEKKAIRLPILVIKKVGGIWAKKISQEREENGLYKDIFDFVARINVIGINKEVYQNLVFAGAFDEFEENRATLIASWERLLLIAKIVLVKGKEINWKLLTEKPQLIHQKRNLEAEWRNEYHVFGFVWDYQKLIAFREKIEQTKKTKIFTVKELNTSEKTQSFEIVLLVESIKTVISKKNEEMAFVQSSDFTGAVEIVVFANLWSRIKIKEGQIIHATLRNQIYQTKKKYFLAHLFQ